MPPRRHDARSTGRAQAVVREGRHGDARECAGVERRRERPGGDVARVRQGAWAHAPRARHRLRHGRWGAEGPLLRAYRRGPKLDGEGEDADLGLRPDRGQRSVRGPGARRRARPGVGLGPRERKRGRDRVRPPDRRLRRARAHDLAVRPQGPAPDDRTRHPLLGRATQWPSAWRCSDAGVVSRARRSTAHAAPRRRHHPGCRPRRGRGAGLDSTSRHAGAADAAAARGAARRWSTRARAGCGEHDSVSGAGRGRAAGVHAVRPPRARPAHRTDRRLPARLPRRGVRCREARGRWAALGALGARVAHRTRAHPLGRPGTTADPDGQCRERSATWDPAVRDRRSAEAGHRAAGVATHRESPPRAPMTARVSFQDRLRRLGLALAGVTVFALVGFGGSLLLLRFIRVAEPSPWSLAVNALSLGLSFGFATWLVGVRLAKRSWDQLGWHTTDGMTHRLVNGATLGAVMAALAIALAFLGSGARVQLTPDWSRWAAQAAPLGCALILAALWEELTFRGLPLRLLADALGPVAAMLVLALGFGIAHARNPHAGFLSTVNVALAAIWLSFAFFSPGGMALAWGLHFGWNAGLALLFDPPVRGYTFHVPAVEYHPGTVVWVDGGAFGPEGGVVATIVLCTGTLAVIGSRFKQPKHWLA